jgi:glycosyltransferase involved in cell wall biosynthesis
MQRLLLYPATATGLSNVALGIDKYLKSKGVTMEHGSMGHLPFKVYDSILHVNAVSYDTLSLWFRYMMWCKKFVFYGTVEGEPVLSPFSYTALKYITMIANSNYTREMLTKAGINVVDMFYNGIDYSFWLTPPKKNAWRRIFGDVNVALAISFRQNRKGFEYLIDAWSNYMKNRDDCILVLHTTSKDLMTFGVDFSKYLADNNIHNIYITEQVGKLDLMSLKELYYACDLYVCPSLAEGFGLTIVEAMACGKPVLCLDAKPMSEHVTNPEFRVKVDRVEKYNYYNVMIFYNNIPNADDYSKLLLLLDKSKLEDEGERNKEFAKRYDYFNAYSGIERYL